MVKPTIFYEDFNKLDLRIGTILEAKEVEGSQKLVEFKLDLGEEIGERTILSGIKNDLDWQAMIGIQVLVLVNLAPKVMMGKESQGMILMAVEKGETGEKITLLVPKEPVTSGTKIM